MPDYFGYIYKITNLINKKIYIGQRKGNPDDSKNYYGSGIWIKHAIKKYKSKNFIKTILCFCASIEETNIKEKYYIKLYRDNNYILYNISDGGLGRGGAIVSQTTRDKISIGNRGKKRSAEHRKKISEYQKGKIKSVETRKKISEAQKGEAQKGDKNHRWGKFGKRIKFKIKKISKKYYREKIIDKNKGIKNPMYGRTHSEETKRKLSERIKGVNHHNYGKRGKELNNIKAVFQIDKETNEIIKRWDSIIEAQIELNLFHISKVCNNKLKTCGKYKWRFVEEKVK